MAAKLGHASPKRSPGSFGKRHYTAIDVDERRSRVKCSLSFPTGLDIDGGASLLEDNLHLDKVGPVTAAIHGDRIIWSKAGGKKMDSGIWNCCTPPNVDEGAAELLISDIYGVQSLGLGPIFDFSPLPSVCCIFDNSFLEMHRFVVYTFSRSPSDQCQWIPRTCIFGHASAEVAQAWVERIHQMLERDLRRPKNLLVLVNPYGGKRQAVDIWEQLVPLFERAAVRTEVVITQKQGHALEILQKATDEELESRDGVVIVGGDGLFGEVLNGLLAHRHKTSPAPKPKSVTKMLSTAATFNKAQPSQDANIVLHEETDSQVVMDREGLCLQRHDLQPLLHMTQSEVKSSLGSNPACDPRNKTSLAAKGYATASTATGQSPKVAEPHAAKTVRGSSEPNKALLSTHDTYSSRPKLRIGLIPAGSTDTIVISTTGTRDPVTAALHIILGDRMPLDIVRLSGWKQADDDNEIPEVLYAASFAAYGFYGEVARESQALRWMGPVRYDFAGFEAFMRHRKFEADISFLEMPDSYASPSTLPHGPWPHQESERIRRSLKKVICRMNCGICAKGMDLSHLADHSDSDIEESNNYSSRPRWRTLARTHFHSIGAAVMSCRNDKAPAGVSAHAHLADGLLHLILIQDCSRFDYFRQLLRLTRKAADPLNFGFVQHYKTPVFTFASHGPESVWSVDGEIFRANQLTAQVFRGLIDIFARGPEV